MGPGRTQKRDEKLKIIDGALMAKSIVSIVFNNDLERITGTVSGDTSDVLNITPDSGPSRKFKIGDVRSVYYAHVPGAL